MPLTLPPEKVSLARAFAAELRPGQRVCITTHVNPDGDGIGSEVGLVHLLRAQGIDAVITNPSPTPPRFSFLFDDLPGIDKTQEAIRELRRADRIIVLDISDLTRLGMLIETVRDRGVPVSCVDHHVSTGLLPSGPRYVDPDAAATGELIFEIAKANDWPVTQAVARALYVAILTDTGGFRFSNTRPRTLRVAADLLETGVDAEQIYLEVYARAPEGRPRLFAEALQTLVVEHEYGVSSDDLDGVVEFPRSIEGVRMALLFREIAQGRVKVSLRSVGDVDVAAFAKAYGGGGHTKAAGLSLTGSLAEVQATVLRAARAYLGGDGVGSQESGARSRGSQVTSRESRVAGRSDSSGSI
jgi:phosphoesterase RecJ-like protein